MSERYLKLYLEAISAEKNASVNTIKAYKRDINLIYAHKPIVESFATYYKY